MDFFIRGVGFQPVKKRLHQAGSPLLKTTCNANDLSNIRWSEDPAELSTLRFGLTRPKLGKRIYPMNRFEPNILSDFEGVSATLK